MHHNYVRDTDKYKKNMVFLFYLIGRIRCREIKNCKKEIIFDQIKSFRLRR